MNKRFFEILMYIVGFFFLTSWFGFFFLELDKLHVFICAITFIVSCVLAFIVASILEKKQKYTEEEKAKNMEMALKIRDDQNEYRIYD